MPTLEGLSKVNALTQSLGNQAQLDKDINNRQVAASQAADLFKSGDIKGALMTLAKADPEHAASLIQQFQQQDPATIQGQAQAQQQGATQGQYNVTTAAGSNPRQMLDAQLAAQREMAQLKAQNDVQSMKQAKADKEQSRGDQWATQVWGKVTSSQPFKNFQDYQAKQATLVNAAQNPSAFGDIGSIFAFMKTLDPQSVVRESEYATASEAGSLFTRARNALAKAEKGEILSPEQRSELVMFTKHLGSVYKQNYDDYLKPVKQQAVKRGVDIDLIDPYNVGPDNEPGIKLKDNNPQNQAALEWLKANPTDPRAPAIRQKLGI